MSTLKRFASVYFTLYTGAALAQTVTIPNAFTPGAPAKAADVVESGRRLCASKAERQVRLHLAARALSYMFRQTTTLKTVPLTLFMVMMASLSAASALPVVSDVVEVLIPGEGLSLSVPKGWHQVPMSTLDQVASEARQRMPNARAPSPMAAFQEPPLVSGELDYPYVLVYTFPSRPPTKEELRAMASKLSPQGMSTEVRKRTDGFGNTAPLVFNFDESTLRVKGAFTAKFGDASVAGYTEIVPSKNGSLSLNGYLVGATAAAAQQFYGPIFAAAHLDAAHAYSPIEKGHSLYQPFDWSRVIIAAISGALIAAILGRKKKPK